MFINLYSLQYIESFYFSSISSCSSENSLDCEVTSCITNTTHNAILKIDRLVWNKIKPIQVDSRPGKTFKLILKNSLKNIN